MFKKLFTSILLLIGFSCSFHSYAVTDLTIKHEDPEKDDKTGMPHAPARSIIYGVLSNDVLTLYSRQDGEASVNIVDSTGTVIADEVTDLTCGYAIFIGDAEGAVYVTVVFNSETYTATL